MILYLGNNLSRHGNTPSSIETLGALLGARYEIKKYSSRKNQLLRGIDMLLALIKFRDSVSVVLVDTYSTLGFYYALLTSVICQYFAIPYIPILHGGNLSKRLQKNKRLCRFVFKRATLLVAPSEYMRKTFQNYGYLNVKSIANSIELEEYKFNPRNAPEPTLLWVRSFHKVYNPLMAIDVLKVLIKSYPKARLCMVGPDRDGSLVACKDYARASGLADRILFPGVLSKLEWHKLSNSYDVFINTTNIDNTPVSVIEAMAMGLPVISTSVGGIPFLIQNNINGLLVESGDVKGMCNRIVDLLNNADQAYALSVAARTSVEVFDWEVVKEKWFEVLDPFENK